MGAIPPRPTFDDGVRRDTGPDRSEPAAPTWLLKEALHRCAYRRARLPSQINIVPIAALHSRHPKTFTRADLASNGAHSDLSLLDEADGVLETHDFHLDLTDPPTDALEVKGCLG